MITRVSAGVLRSPGRYGEFFSLWGLAGHLSATVGPLTYGVASWLSHGDHRLAMLITDSYFGVGVLLLAGIDAERGKRAALDSDRVGTSIDFVH
ncbi:MAG: hypothetical protein ACXWJZ_16245 [Burkholderiaceae bacterium]